MRILIILMAIGIIVVGIVTMAPTRKEKTEKYASDILFFHDRTIENENLFSVEDVIVIAASNKDKWPGRRFRYVPLTDMSISKVREFVLKPANQLLSNEIDRKKALEDFGYEIVEVISNAKSDTSGRDHSELYLPIARELERFVSGNNKGKDVYLASDLFQNSTWFSVYIEKDFKVLKDYPERIRNLFEEQAILPNLTGIRINIIYQPKSVEDDEMFKVVSGFWKALFESKSARVTISASLI